MFDASMDVVVRKVYIMNHGRRVKENDNDSCEWLPSELIFTDDAALVADWIEQLQCLVTEIFWVCEGRKLGVNAKKSEVMAVREFVEVEDLCEHLDGCFSKECNLQDDVRMRVGKRLKTFGAMNKIFMSAV